MIRNLAIKLAKIIAPILFVELINVLETITQTDIDQDGDIGK